MVSNFTNIEFCVKLTDCKNVHTGKKFQIDENISTPFYKIFLGYVLRFHFEER